MPTICTVPIAERNRAINICYIGPRYSDLNRPLQVMSIDLSRQLPGRHYQDYAKSGYY